MSGEPTSWILGPGGDVGRIGLGLHAGELSLPGPVAGQLLPVGLLGRVVIDLGLHEAGDVELGQLDRLLVGVGDDAVDHDRLHHVGGEAVGARGLVPGAEDPRLGVEVADRRAHRGEAHLGHHRRAAGAADGAVEVDPVGGHAGDARTHPDLLGHLDRARRGRRTVRPSSAVRDDLVDLLEALAAARHVKPEGVELVLGRAAPDAQVKRLLGEQAEHRDLAGESQRLVPRQHQHAGAERQLREAAGDVAGQHQRARRREVVAEVVLDQPDRPEAELGVVLDVIEHGPVDSRVGGARGVRRRCHDAEGHLSTHRMPLQSTNGAIGPNASPFCERAQGSQHAAVPSPITGWSQVRATGLPG